MMMFAVVWYDGNENHIDFIETNNYKKDSIQLGLPPSCEQIIAMIEVDPEAKFDEPVELDDLRIVLGLADDG